MELATRDIALGDLRERLERAFGPVAEQKRLEFEVAVSGANVAPTINTDPQRLEQILRNLLSNAFKFTDEGSVTLTIGEGPTGDRYMNERLNHAERIVSFAVSDTGIGIPHDKLRLIFEAFQQADGTTSRRYGGTGLGLSISREIACSSAARSGSSRRPARARPSRSTCPRRTRRRRSGRTCRRYCRRRRTAT